MSVFNPNVPQGQDKMPDWQKASNATSSPQVDLSAGLGLKALATGIEGAVDIGKEAVQGIISDDVRKTVEPIRDDFTKELELARNTQQRNVIPAPVQTAQGPSTGDLTGQPQQPVPDAIAAGVDKVQALQTALSQGKINDTYYDLRLKDAVTGLRSKYPGFVDMIDQKVSAITGINPANAYIQNLMQDINASRVNKKTATDTAIDTAMKSGYPDSDVWVNRLRQGGEQVLPAYQDWYSQQTMLDSQLKRKDALRRDTQASRGDVVEQRTADWTNEAGANVQSALSTMTKISGLDKPQNVLQMIQDANENPDKYTEAQYKQLAMQISTKADLMEAQLTARMSSTKGLDGKPNVDSQGRTYSYASDIGAEKAQSILQNQVKVLRTVAKGLTDNQVGLAFWAANHALATLDQTKDNLINDPNNDWAAKVSTFQTLMGPNWTNLSVDSGLRSNIDQKMRGYLDNSLLDARLNTNNVTMKKHFEDADQLQGQQKISANMKSRYIGNLVNVVDDIKNPNAPDKDKLNVVKYIFSPEGQGILSHIKTDYTDPNTGKLVPGKYSVFSRLTSDDIVQSINKLSKSDPSVLPMYKNYIEREAGKELFGKEFQNLNQFTGHDDLHVKYNDGGKGGIPSIELIPPNNPPGTDPGYKTQGYLFQVQKVINRINDGMAGVARVENGTGGNVSEYMMSFLQRSQVEFNKNWEGLPKAIGDAIAITSAKGKLGRQLEDTFK